MTALTLRPTGRSFRRIGGREGHWRSYADRRDRAVPLDPDDDVVCPFDFYEVPGIEAEVLLVELQRACPGKTPVLFGSPHEAGILFERRRNRGRSAEEWLVEADRFDLDAWLSGRAAKFASQEDFPPRGPWPTNATTYTQLTVPIDILTEKPKPTVIIGLLPTSDPTEAAAHLGFGGWHDCPPPPVHVALARRWHERYGAIQVSCTYETVEFRVAKPLTDRDAAMRLAWEQLYWCSDSVPDTLEHAAAELIGSTVWVFWWD